MKNLLLILIAIPVVYLGITHGVAGLREDRTQEAFPPLGNFAEIDGQRIHAVIEGEGPDVVLIHGAGGNTRDFNFSFSSQLAERGYRVITVDRPGFGYSDPVNEDPASLKLQADLLSRAVASLGADKPIVVGHSLGGAVALAWASQYPDRLSGLLPLSAVSNTWIGDTDPLFRAANTGLGRTFLVPALSAFVSKGYIENVISGVFEPQPFVEGYDKEIGATLTIRRKSLKVNAAERVALKANVELQVPDYANINVPTEIVHGDADTTVGFDTHVPKLSQQIEGAVVTRLPGIGHMPHHVAADETLDAIDQIAARAGLK